MLLDRLTIERALQRAAEGPIVAALSGGGDSIALVHLLVQQLGPRRVRPVIVDHALREGSGADAKLAQELSAPLGVTSEIVTLDWAGAPRRSQQAARNARYHALCAAAHNHGSRIIALGHTADDQAETVLMRAAGRSGWRGLAAMRAIAPAPVWPEGRDIVLARPLMGARRADLRTYLEERGAGWIEDPANRNAIFERVRVRERLSRVEAAGFDPMILVRLAQRLAPLVSALDVAAGRLIERAAYFEGPAIAIERSAWSGDQQVRARTLSVLLASAAGSERLPESAAVERLDGRLLSDGFRGAALSGARVSLKGGRLRIGRDPGALMGRADGATPLASLALPKGQDIVWDGRLLLRALASGWEAGPSEDGNPVFRRGAETVTLAAALGSIMEVEWLLESHVRHLLVLH